MFSCGLYSCKSCIYTEDKNIKVTLKLSQLDKQYEYSNLILTSVLNVTYPSLPLRSFVL